MVIGKNNERVIPFIATHPGTILGYELEERQIKHEDFAKALGIETTHLEEILEGKCDVTENVACGFEKQLGIPHQFWVKMQTHYWQDLKAIAEREAREKEAKGFLRGCSGFMNTKSLRKSLGFFSKTCRECVQGIKELLPTSLSSDMFTQVIGLFSRSVKAEYDIKTVRTWLVLNWIAAARVSVENEYVEGNAIKAAEDIARMANQRTMSIRAVRECLAKYGIAYVEVQAIEKAPVDAFSSLQDGHPYISVTYRCNDMDKLAHDLLHELCHIDRHLIGKDAKGFITVEGVDYTKDPREIEANTFARRMLIPDKVWSGIMRTGCKTLTPSRILKVVAEEAAKRGVSPSIAAARYKQEMQCHLTSHIKSPRIYVRKNPIDNNALRLAK